MTPFKANTVIIENSNLDVSPMSKVSYWGDIENTSSDLSEVVDYSIYTWNKFINQKIRKYFIGPESNRALDENKSLKFSLINPDFVKLNMMIKIDKLILNSEVIPFTYIYNGIQFILNSDNFNSSVNWISFVLKDNHNNPVFQDLENWTIQCTVI